MRGVIYKNSKYPGYSKTMFGNVDGWGSFLNTIGAGHTFSSEDLRAVPGSILLAKLKPMLYDTDLAFTLEYYDSRVVSEVVSIAEEFEKTAPRQSGAYIVSRVFTGINLLQNTEGDSAGSAGEKTAGKSNLAYILNQLGAALSAWNGLKELQARDKDNTPTDASKSYWPGEDVKKIVDETKKKVGSYSSAADKPKDFYSWSEDSDSPTWNWYVDSMMTYRAKAISELEDWEEYALITGTPSPVYTLDSENARGFCNSIKTLAEHIHDYCNYINDFLKEESSNARLTPAGVVVRFYPQNVLLTEPLRQIETVHLSENSFVQVGKPQQNMVATFVNNMALDTPDTQWRELYARIFNIIAGHGNPVCKARIGRYLLEDCYLMTVPDLTQSINPAPVFSFNLISEHWDSRKLSAINFVG